MSRTDPQTRSAHDFAPSGRARTADGLRSLLSSFSTPEGIAHAMCFRPASDDVIIATYAKSGTTLMQQIVHGLRTRGDMDFRDISEVVPWIEVAHDLEQDLDADQVATPRAFKTHFDGDAMPRGGRVIWIVRDPIDVLVSFYHFNVGWFMEPGSLDLESFALDYVLRREGRHDYWHHLVSWWGRLDDEAALALCYEDVVADREGTVGRVARFIGVPAEPDRLAIATRQASKEFMLRYAGLWEDVRLREYRSPAMGLPADAGGTKVRADGDGDALANVTDRVREAWDERWRTVVAPVTGCPDYASLRADVAARRGEVSSR